MSRSRWVSLFAAGLLALTACSDATTPSGPSPASVIPPAKITLSGVVSATGRDPLNALVLTTEDGSRITLLVSAETSALGALAGAGVDVRGRWDGDQSFVVDEFIVREVGGTPVLDGILVEQLFSDLGDDPVIGYVLRLRDGSAASLIDPSPELLTHIGARMWVRLDDAGEARDFGIIDSY